MSWKEQITIDNIVKLIEALKPKFYNKLTWVVVITGISFITKPLWETIISEILKKEFKLNITNENDFLAGLSLVIVGLLYNLLTVYLHEYLTHKQNSLKDIRIIGADKKLFEDFLNQLPSSGSIEFLKNHSFENIFNLDELEQVRKIYHTWNGAEYEFLDDNIEALRKDLFNKIEKFIYESSMKTYPQKNGLQWAIPDAYRGDFTYPEHVRETINNLNTLADDVYKAHQGFVKECRQKLV